MLKISKILPKADIFAAQLLRISSNSVPGMGSRRVEVTAMVVERSTIGCYGLDLYGQNRLKAIPTIKTRGGEPHWSK